MSKQRELKFRAWTKAGSMVYNVVPWHWDFVIDTMSHKCIESNGEGILGSGGTKGRFEVPGIAHEAIMQFTGLHDKNGREIYEGDVLLGSHMDAVDGNSEVCYIDGMLSLRVGDRVRPFSTTERTRAGWCLAGRGTYGSIEVIGNIYEHPELIPA